MKRFRKRGKKANILTENIIFIVLNLVFLSILILFLFSRMSTSAVLEERYAKQIAMLIDSAKPGMEIKLDMSKGIKKLEKDFDKDSIVSINKNIVTVRLKEGTGYSYSFFNDAGVSSYFHEKKDNKEWNRLILIIGGISGENEQESE